MERRFVAWSERPLRALAHAGPGAVGGRLQAVQPLAVRDLDNPTFETSGDAPFELFGPGDVVRIAPSTITRRYPAPGAIDAEETKAALVEVEPDDLPWRYSPEIPTDHEGGRGLRPWLVLVVGTRGTDELSFAPDGRVGLGPAVQQAHRLSDSWRWAHVHEVPRGSGTQRIARILCPRDMNPTSDYTACLVPAFVVDRDAAGDSDQIRDAWPSHGGATVWLPCYDSWAFRTAPDGDFAQIASRLNPAHFANDSLFGLAEVTYTRRIQTDPPQVEPGKVELGMDGALRRPGQADLPPVAPDVGAEVAALTRPVPAPPGRWVLTAPRYAEPFVGSTPTTWASQLARDPRRRASAGLGARAAIAWQDRIAAAAAQRGGDLAIVRDRVNQVAFGLEASRGLWRRRVPQDDPVAALSVLGPVLARLPVDVGEGFGTDALTALARRTPLFARALWSSAARRALRPGPARTSLAQQSAASFPALVTVAGGCRDAAQDPAELPLSAQLPPDPGGRREWEMNRLHEALGQFHPVVNDLKSELSALIAELGELAPDWCEPVEVGRLGTIVAEAVDPTVPRPLVVDRVLGDHADLGPVELEPELDLPLWSFLATAAPEWLLPGIGRLPRHSVVGLATNPAFVQALLVGANHQATAELRFRNFPLRPRWSPLRKFWQRPDTKVDIRPIKRWGRRVRLGNPTLQPRGVGEEAVVLLRSPLFQRYPGTVVYLYDAGPNWHVPDAFDDARKVFPTFTGKVGEDVVFFGFALEPEALAHHWVVLEEPPSGYRFYLEDPKEPNKPHPALASADSAAYAYGTFAAPVRVMIAELIGPPA